MCSLLPHRSTTMHWGPSLACMLALLAWLSDAGRLVDRCGDLQFPDVVCIDRYGTYMPGVFKREPSDTYRSTSIQDPSFAVVKNAKFLVFDSERARGVLGSQPSVRNMFPVDDGATDAPVYVPDTNELWIGGLRTGDTSQYVVDLGQDNPQPQKRTLSPPIYAANGMRYHSGRVWVSAAGGNDTLQGGPYHPGIYSFDPKTGNSKVEANNYYGWFINSANDLDIDSSGRVWFTDPLHSRNMGVNENAPFIQPAVYRYNPGSGELRVVDDTLEFPNGITFSPDGKTLYVANTAAAVGNTDPNISWEEAGPLKYNSTGKRTIYAFDVTSDGILQNRRPIYTSMDYVADGMRVASNGYLVASAGYGVDILDAGGSHLARIQLDFIATNVEFAGPRRDELWIVGHGQVARAYIGLTGLMPSTGAAKQRLHVQGHTHGQEHIRSICYDPNYISNSGYYGLNCFRDTVHGYYRSDDEARYV
ncbi:hypothetical protein NUW58_g9727 [Xylaria curta]|uniref:Uncharacterized protein n=1 Tax=Xylaria curta TaxID=42375 RepID=A0ACC1MTK7_9PEZI|nr:hypothetical protein NUW58_g9727 [Xylaria curta]